MSTSNVLQEYLIALGFKIDTAGGKKVTTALKGWDKDISGLGLKIAGVAGALQAMVVQFAFSMEKLYYSSKRTGATVANIKSLEHGATQIGLASGEITASLEAMAKSMRMNPGMQALLNSLGVRVEGRDKSDVLKDLVKELAKMPHFVGAQFAEMFGMDEQTFLMLKEGIAELEKAQDLQKQMAANAGVDYNKAAEAAKDYANALRGITMQAGLLKDKLMIELLPAFKASSDFTNEVLRGWIGILNGGSLPDDGKGGKTREVSKKAGGMLGGLFADWFSGERVELSADSKRRLGRLSGGTVDYSAEANLRQIPPPTKPNPSPALFDRLEKQYGLLSGLLDRMWETESARGKFMTGPMTSSGQAQGHFQFMSGTAKQYGVNDPMDLEQSATGAAKYLSDLMKKYGGDIASAVAAYNWGPGNLDKYKLGEKKSLPVETEDYIKRVAGESVVLHQDTKIIVQGGNADATGRAVANEQRTVNSDLLRNFKGAVR